VDVGQAVVDGAGYCGLARGKPRGREPNDKLGVFAFVLVDLLMSHGGGAGRHFGVASESEGGARAADGVPGERPRNGAVDAGVLGDEEKFGIGHRDSEEDVAVMDEDTRKMSPSDTGEGPVSGETVLIE